MNDIEWKVFFRDLYDFRIKNKNKSMVELCDEADKLIAQQGYSDDLAKIYYHIIHLMVD